MDRDDDRDDGNDGRDVITGPAPEPWTGPVLAVYLTDSRAVGPFPDPAAATAWLRAVPNSLFDSASTLEHARDNGDVWLAALEPPDAPRLCPDVAYPDVWDEGWGPSRLPIAPGVIAEARRIQEAHEEGGRHDAGFDGGEFSGPANARAEARALSALAARHGVTLEDLELAVMEDEGDGIILGD